MSYLLIGTHVGAAAAAVALTALFMDARHDAAVGEIYVTQVDAQAKAVNVVREKERANNARTIKALNEAQRQNRNRAGQLAAAERTASGLRTQLSTADARIRTASREAVAEYATTANAVLGECQREYLEMANKAQGHANDVRTLDGAWPGQE